MPKLTEAQEVALIAKAMNYVHVGCDDCHTHWKDGDNPYGGVFTFEPHTNDGDAFRAMVRLEIQMEFGESGDRIFAYAEFEGCMNKFSTRRSFGIGENLISLRSLRRTNTRLVICDLAIQIGQKMP